jgi:hypothetical protein
MFDVSHSAKASIKKFACTIPESVRYDDAMRRLAHFCALTVYRTAGHTSASMYVQVCAAIDVRNRKRLVAGTVDRMSNGWSKPSYKSFCRYLHREVEEVIAAPGPTTIHPPCV